MRLRNMMAKAGVVAAAAGSVLALQAPAQAAANPYSPQAACGSGYYVIDSAPLRNSSHGTGGRVYLLYKNGRNCVATIKNVAVGRSTYTKAVLNVFQPTGGISHYNDFASYKYYANVSAYAGGRCVSASGYTYDRSGNFYSGSISTGHCG